MFLWSILYSGYLRDMNLYSQSEFSPKPIAIKAENLFKEFPFTKSRNTLFKSLKNLLKGNSYLSSIITALNDINFEVASGEWIGLIGHNGSGKSTLLKVLAELYKPSRGKVFISGRKVLFTGFGIGMIDELTVRDNIFLYGAMYGLANRDIDENLGEIIDWAELTEFLGTKTKNLSSGMRTRLAFSIMRHIACDIYLYDEALSAGDKAFKIKCEEYFYRSRDNEHTAVVATHDLNFVKKFCDRTIWLHKGKQMAFGDTESVLEQYSAFDSGDTVNRK